MKGELCAAMCVTLLNLRLQNCGWPLHGCVFMGCTEVDVLVALSPVPLTGRLEPPITVTVAEVLELDVEEFDALPDPVLEVSDKVAVLMAIVSRVRVEL